MARFEPGDRIRDAESRRFGTVWQVSGDELLVDWDEPMPNAASSRSLVGADRCEVIASYLRGHDGRVRRGYDYHRWRADHGAAMDHEAALLEEATVLIEAFFGHS